MTRSVVLYVAILVTGLFLGSCKKESGLEIPNEFPVTLIPERWEVREQIRLFTDKREVLDQNIIRDFESQENLGQWLENSFSSEFTGKGLIFGSELVAHFGPIRDAESSPYSINRKGNRFLFYSRDAYGINPALPPSANSLGSFHAMLKYSDKLSEPNPQGLRQTREVRVAHGNYKVLKVSAFVYALNSHTSVNGEVAEAKLGGLIFNEFTDEVIKFLSPTDTLAVKEYSIIYSRGK